MTVPPPSPHIAARNIITWLRAATGDPTLTRIDLDLVRQLLPETPQFEDVREITSPVPFDAKGFEGMLARDPGDPQRWGIMYNRTARPERQRFTIAHEIGHLVLHRHQQAAFQCSKQEVHYSPEDAKQMEREADNFAANLLMPGDRVSVLLDGPDTDFYRLSEAATEFGVSLEAMCLRFIKYTQQRAILIHWDNGFLNYQWRSQSAMHTRTHIKRQPGTMELADFPNTLTADENVAQEWVGETMPANLWCPTESPAMKVRECKHSYSDRDRVLTLLFFEDAEPPKWKTGWEDEEATEMSDGFVRK